MDSNHLVVLPVGLASEASRSFLHGLNGLLPGSDRAAEVLLSRIATPNWALEWGLADWVARPLRLNTATARGLLLANLYTLAWARLTDDLADGEWQPGDAGQNDGRRSGEQDEAAQRSETVVLAAGLHQLLLGQYLRLFEQHDTSREASVGGTLETSLFSRFWDYADRFLGEWLEATVHDGTHAFKDSAVWRVSLLEQASRGAFLKVVCAAACLLGGREEAIPVFANALDHLMVGVVMLDDLFDWVDDLDGSRRNVLVAYCSVLPQTEAHREANRQSVLRELYLGEAAAGYFEQLRDHLQEAHRWAIQADCDGLAEFIARYDQEVIACAGWVGDRATTALSAAAERWLEGPVGDCAGSGRR